MDPCEFASPALAAMLFSAAQAQDYPAKPVHLVVPYVAGGNADIFGRTPRPRRKTRRCVQTALHRREPRRGRNGGIGTDFVAKAAARRLPRCSAKRRNGPITVNPVLYARVPYDPVQGTSRRSRKCVVYQYGTGDPGPVRRSGAIRRPSSRRAGAPRKAGAQSPTGPPGFGGGKPSRRRTAPRSRPIPKLTHRALQGQRAATAPRRNLLGRPSSRSCFDNRPSPRFPQIRAGKVGVRSPGVERETRLGSSGGCRRHAGGGHRGLRYLASGARGVLARPAGNSAGGSSIALNAEIPQRALNAPEVQERLGHARGQRGSSSEPPKDLASLIKSDLQEIREARPRTRRSRRK